MDVSFTTLYFLTDTFKFHTLPPPAATAHTHTHTLEEEASLRSLQPVGCLFYLHAIAKMDHSVISKAKAENPRKRSGPAAWDQRCRPAERNLRRQRGELRAEPAEMRTVPTTTTTYKRVSGSHNSAGARVTWPKVCGQRASNRRT